MIQLTSVRAGYGGGDVLQGVDLVVESGSIACIVGPNGAGKSTVLRAVSGLLAPREGSIRLSGQPIRGWSPARVMAAGIVQVPQQDGLFPDLTVRDNMLLGGYLIRRDKPRLRRRLAELAGGVPDHRRAGRRPRRGPVRRSATDRRVRPRLRAGAQGGAARRADPGAGPAASRSSSRPPGPSTTSA